MKFWKIPNKLYEYKLTSCSFYLYNFLCNKFYFKDTVRIKLATIGYQTDMSVNTVRRCLQELEDAGLVKSHKRFAKATGMRTTSEYALNRLQGAFAKVEPAVFRTARDDKSRVYVYCAVKYYEFQNSQKAFPSYGQLVKLTGLSRATVISKVQKLNAEAMFAKTLYLRNRGDYGHNNYALISMTLRVYLLLEIARFYGRYLCITIGNDVCDIMSHFFSTIMGSLKFDKHIIDKPELRKKMRDVSIFVSKRTAVYYYMRI